ncbi:MAG: hypothetical protein J6V21_08655 [Alistipes sp.]|nr:hypothetical protein [Alistipes sp.]
MTIETKYNIGDYVWAIVENRAQRLRIKGIAVSTLGETFDESGKLLSYRIEIKYYLGDGDWANDVACFPTKEELLKSL